MQPAPPNLLLRFAHPQPPRAGVAARQKIVPVFLPFAGCPERCVFCNQTAQTGQPPESLEAAFTRARAVLEALPPPAVDTAPVELAFYGGTFTALPETWIFRFLDLAAEFRAQGRLGRLRCSTRPDAASPRLLTRLKASGLDLIELGVQSFADAALCASRRGYDGATAQAGCQAVREAGLALGVQLMPGMPGHTPEMFARDVAIAAAFQPEFVRLYPCLVLEGTPLAELWRAGTYTPWQLDETVDALAQALCALWAAGIPAARIGLAEEPGLPVLAGPRHPALGQMVRAKALYFHVRALLPSLAAQGGGHAPANTLFLPRRLQGEALGQNNALAAHYAALGLRIALWDEAELGLASESSPTPK